MNGNKDKKADANKNAVSQAYGLLKKKPKRNRKLERKLKSIEPILEQCAWSAFRDFF